MDIERFAGILKQHGIYHGAGVPCSVFTPLVNHITVDTELDYISAASEGEAVAIAAGMTANGRPAFALMQNSGLGNAVNPITSLLYIYGIPSVLLVSQRGEPGRPDEPQHLLMGQITEELARLCELRTARFHPDHFEQELAQARADGAPAAWIFPRDALTGGKKLPSRKVVLSSATVTPGRAGTFSAELRREQMLSALLPLLNGGLDAGRAPVVVSSTGKLSRELYELDDRGHDRKNRFYMVGSLGCAAGFGLGIAHVSPASGGRKVVVLDGDGAVLMKMGTLATVGSLGPKNLHHVLLDNGAHESTGGQPTASPHVDFASVALACGYRTATTVATADEAYQALATQLSADGPSLLRIAIQTGARADLGRPKLSPQDNWIRFCRYLAEPVR